MMHVKQILQIHDKLKIHITVSWQTAYYWKEYRIILIGETESVNSQIISIGWKVGCNVFSGF